jgi:tetratricopeptide (TPR) repeat protein
MFLEIRIRRRIVGLLAGIILGGLVLGNSAFGQNYDGYDDIDWDGPDVMSRTTLDFAPISVKNEIRKFRRVTSGIASSIPSRPLNYAAALASIKSKFGGNLALALEQLKSRTAGANQSAGLEPLGLSAVAKGSLSYNLGVQLVRHEADPNNPTILYNLASSLTQAGMPNEAIALLERINAVKTKPDVAFGFVPSAALDYLHGYSLLMTGRLSEAQVLLRAALAADENLTDANYALAIAEQQIGGDVRKPLLKGLWRLHSTKPPMYLGDDWEKDPLTDDVDQLVAIPADALFDLSKGTDGVLPRLPHPASGEQLLKMVLDMPVEAQKIKDEVVGYAQAADKAYQALSRRLDREGPDAQDLVSQALCDILEETNATLKPLQHMRVQKNTRLNAIEEAQDRSIQAVQGKLISLNTEEMSVEARKALARSIVSEAMGIRRPTINAYDTAVRQHFRAWHKYASGLAGLMTDEKWHEYADLRIRAMAAAQWYELYATIVGSYAASMPVSPEIYLPDAALPKPPALEPKEVWHCDPSSQKGSVEAKLLDVKDIKGLPGFGLTAKMNCDKATLEAEAKVGIDLTQLAGLGGVSAGGFVETSVNRKGDITIYGGPKASMDVGPLSASMKDGLYVTVDDQGIKEVGTKVTITGSAGAGGVKGSVKAGEETFTIWAAPPRPEKFSRKSGLTIWGNVD